MKRLVVFLVVVVVLVTASDFLLRVAAENVVAGLVDDRITKDGEPEVDLGGFPFLFSLLEVRFDEMTVVIPEATHEEVTVEHVELTFTEVRADAFELLGGGGTVRARSVAGSGSISEADFARVVDRHFPGVTVELNDNRVTMSRAGVSASATAVVAANRILISAGEVAAPVDIPLPSLMSGVQFSSLEVYEGELVLRIEGSRVRIRV